MTATLQIQLFGGMRVALDGMPVKDFYSNKAPALLAYLAVTRRAPSRDALAALFWGEMSDAGARTNLRQCLANLRKLVEPHLSIARDAVEFNFDTPYLLDVEQFELQLGADCLGEAVALYKGDFLDGVFVRDAPEFEEWAIAQRARLRELALQAMHTLARQHAARGEYARGIDYATDLIALDPWREETHRELMVMLARSGQRSVALQQYEVCRRILAQEMGVEPSADTTALYERIRAAGELPRYNLPAQVTAFVGREAELNELRQRLADPACRLMTLVGPGGIGKTRLALEAAKSAQAFLHGACFVPLTPHVSAECDEILVSAIADALRFGLHSEADAQTQLLDYLREKELLLVIDSAELLAECATLLAEILSGAPEVKILATSRERLNLRGEWALPLAGLQVPLDRNAQETHTSGAMQLFVQCAQRVQPGFALTQADASAVARICRLVKGMPLGIELAAAWVRALDCQGIAQEIERNLDFLASTQPDALERHKSLRAVFDSAWQRLSEAERTVFCRLSVLRSGFGREAAERIAGASVPVLSALVDKALLWRSPAGRYELHDVMRQYAQEKLAASGEECQTRDRHGEYYAEFLRQREAHLKGNRQKEALTEISVEIENARAAWQWAIAPGRALNLAVIHRCMETLFTYWEMRASFQEGERAFAEAAAAFGAANTALARLDRNDCITLANLLARQSWYCFRMARYEPANELVLRSLDILRGLEAWQDTAYPLLFAGACAFGRGDLSACRQLFLESCAVYKRLGDAWGIAGVLNNLGQVATAAGNYDAADRFIQEGLRVARATDIRHLIGHILNNLGGLRLAVGDHAGARQALQESLSFARDSDEPYLIASALNNLGAIALALNDPVEAERHYQEAEGLVREMGDRWALANALNGLGHARLRLNQAQASQLSFLRALHTAFEIGAASVALNSVQGIATIMAQGQVERALELAEFVLHHASSEQATKDKAKQLLRDLTPRLPTSLVEAARKRGTDRDLREVVMELEGQV